MQTPAAFTFESYCFPSTEIHLGELPDDVSLLLDFNPSGEFTSLDNSFTLHFDFTATPEGADSPAVRIRCSARFKFREPTSLDRIPDYFFPNSLAIVFPYLRAFVSSVTLQANTGGPIVIPTLNLSSLRDTLRANTRAV